MAVDVNNGVKPSEAMFKGLRSYKFKQQIRERLTDGKGGFCALGAMYLGYGYTPAEIDEGDYSTPEELYTVRESHGPGDHGRSGQWESVVTDRNDKDGALITDIARDLALHGL